MAHFFLASVADAVGPTAAVVRDDQVFVIPDRPALADLFADWDAQLERLGRDLDSGALADPVAVDAVSFLAPVPAPPNLYMVGGNYADHSREMQKLGPDVPVPPAVEGPFVFLKPTTALAGHRESIVLAGGFQRIDWEVELAVVIGRRAHKISAARAQDHVAGYTVANDISVRDNFIRSSDVDPPLSFDWFGQKAWLRSCPIGPWLAPNDGSLDPNDLALRLSVNGEIQQDSRTSLMLHSVDEIIAYIANMIPLLPGDTICTGTPAGVGMGHGRFLNAGDEVVAEVEHIGALRNHVVTEAEAGISPELTASH
jgi:2-keto-4-pentenoate hydratase/2-oxohepta-3-ene-1,7-dioic acid hydratase in catechol pathway